MVEFKKVLVVEDEYLVLMGLKSNLEDLGYHNILEAQKGEKAVELALKEMPDLILMDINLPDIDGIEALKRINDRLIVPSIIISGYHESQLVEKAKNVGVFAYLIKPVDKKDLKVNLQICSSRFEEFLELKKDYNDARQALEDRKIIERAKGILMDNNNLKEAEAMATLQKKSQNKNQKLIKVAQDIIKASELLDAGD